MKHWILYWGLAFSLVVIPISAFTHETTGWIAPEGARKMKNPVKPTEASVEKGKEIYEKKCAPCHGANGDGKGPARARLSPKPTNFKDPHAGKMTDGEHFWKITTGRGPMPSFAKDLAEEERWYVVNYINTLMKHK